MSSQGTVLLTGATGFVGMELLARYLERGDRELVTLVRAPSDEAAAARLDAVLANMFGRRARNYAGRVRAVAGELTAPRLGLGPDRYDALAAEVSTIIHTAASVSFVLPLEQARAINLDGTRQVLQFARQAQKEGGLERVAHLSTAYVAGDHSGRFGECDLDLGQRFHNTYERSKFETEMALRSYGDLPFTILRPSIVVGERHSGWTVAFNVLYWPLRAFARGLFTSVPAVASAPVDVVSVDYVADAVHELCESPGGIGETYHLTAGAKASTIGEIASAASRYFKRPPPLVVPPLEYAAHANGNGSGNGMLEDAGAYFPYFSIGARFEDALTRARLEPRGIAASPLSEYLERLLDFATRTRWGKRPISRVEALAG